MVIYDPSFYEDEFDDKHFFQKIPRKSKITKQKKGNAIRQQRLEKQREHETCDKEPLYY